VTSVDANRDCELQELITSLSTSGVLLPSLMTLTEITHGKTVVVMKIITNQNEGQNANARADSKGS
jgi:hypothetical protein